MSNVENLLKFLPKSLGKTPITSDIENYLVGGGGGGVRVGKELQRGGVVISNHSIIREKDGNSYPVVMVRRCFSYPKCDICKIRNSCKVGNHSVKASS